MFCDLHFHTHFSSDALSVPEEVMPLMAKSGCKGLAVTDHDALEAIAIFAARADDHGLEQVAGVEIDTDYPRWGHLHIMGYGFDPEHPAIREVCAREVDFGDRLYEAVLAGMIREGLIDDRRAFEAWARGDWPRRRIGHKQLTRWLVLKGVATDMTAAKAMFKERSEAAGLTHTSPHPKDAIAAVQAAGGVGVFAHPAHTCEGRLEEIVDDILELGAVGLEAYTPSNGSEEDIRRVADIARDRGVIATGGSDLHGPSTVDVWPSKAPYECFEALKDLLG